MTKLNGHKPKKFRELVKKTKAKRKTRRITLAELAAEHAKDPYRACVHITPCWSVIDNETGVEVSVREREDRWFDARSAGVALLGQKLGRSVSQDAVRLEWLP